MTYYIQRIPFPDAASAVSYWNEGMDLEEYTDTYPNGLSEAVAFLRFTHPELSDTDITTLATAVQDYATRPNQDTPMRASLVALARGVGIRVELPPPPWEHPTDGLRSLPPALQPAPRFRDRVRSFFREVTHAT